LHSKKLAELRALEQVSFVYEKIPQGTPRRRGEEAEEARRLVKLKTLLPLCALLASGMAQAADRDERWLVGGSGKVRS